MSDSTLPPNKDDDAHRARQATALKIVVVMLLVFAVVVGFFLTMLPLPVRIMVAASDVIAAIVLATIIRQRFSRR